LKKDGSAKQLSILGLLLELNSSSAPYNEYLREYANRHNVTLCSYFQSEIPILPSIRYFSGEGTFLGFWNAMKKAFEVDRYDVIHAHSPHVGVFSLLFNGFNPFRTRRMIYTVHTSYENYKIRNKLFTSLIFLFFRRIVFVSQSSFDSFPRILLWLANNRTCVIQNGVDIARLDRSVQQNIRDKSQDPFTIVVIGRLIPSKNPLVVLRAFEQNNHQSSRLVFIGDGPLRDKIQVQAQSAQIGSRVTITGVIAREAVYQLLADADLFVSASRVEGLPISVLEAMSAFCPVVLSDIPPHREIVEGMTGVPLVPVGDVPALSDAMKRMMQMPKAERRFLGKQGRHQVEDRFSLATMHHQYEKLYYDIT
jgi:glycosyltransferase involved in cell wall biosynthesis